MSIAKVGVVGAGAMGSGIAQVLSQAGLEVILKDVEKSYVDKGLANIKRMYDSRVAKEVISQAQAEQFFGLIKGATDYKGFEAVDLVIEAALEEINVKLKIFQELDSICPPKAILASNTSALSISEIAANTRRAEKVLGMHFFNPAQTMKLVEVIPGVQTSTEAVQQILVLCQKLNKIAIRVNECPGFLVNRILFPYMNEALYVLQEGIATPEEIDKAVVEFGLPMGPFTLFDMTGIDVCAHVNNFLFGEYGSRFTPSPLLSELVAAKALGQKTGAGFYLHRKEQPSKDIAKEVNPNLQKYIQIANQTVNKNKSTKPFDVYRIILPMFNEAAYAIQEDVVAASDVDVAVQWGLGLKRGILSIAGEKGLDWCLEKLDSYHKELGDRFLPAWLLRKLARARLHDFSNIGSSAKPTPLAVR
jgi:3-hydroxyacyl-CoA dehydrogenase